MSDVHEQVQAGSEKQRAYGGSFILLGGLTLTGSIGLGLLAWGAWQYLRNYQYAQAEDAEDDGEEQDGEEQDDDLDLDDNDYDTNSKVSDREFI